MTVRRLHGELGRNRSSQGFNRLLQSMYFENNRTLPLTPEWSAEFVFRYQVSMSGDGWGLVLHGPEGKTIDRLKDFINFCGPGGPEQNTDEDLMRFLSLSKDNRYLTIRAYDADWVADLETCALWVQSERFNSASAWVDDPEDADPRARSASAFSPILRRWGCLSLILLVALVLLAKLIAEILRAT
ncbi:MAG: hypothetical protein EOP83_17140 [Verrucomicrobiaceae bacterium]|nr:MAG: hypothetical protein EOP83_17140 [Verrucomicrobiaceae bacterium]